MTGNEEVRVMPRRRCVVCSELRRDHPPSAPQSHLSDRGVQSSPVQSSQPAICLAWCWFVLACIRSRMIVSCCCCFCLSRRSELQPCPWVRSTRRAFSFLSRCEAAGLTMLLFPFPSLLFPSFVLCVFVFARGLVGRRRQLWPQLLWRLHGALDR